MYICRNELTDQLMMKYIEDFKGKSLARLNKLYRYYDNKNDTILNRSFADDSKPNNKLAHPYAAYITDTLSAYMVGKPVAYACPDEIVNTNIDGVMDYNDSADNDIQLAEYQSIYGVAYELMYVDEDSMIRFKALDPRECVALYDGTVENNLKYFIRFVEENDPVTNVERAFAWVYSAEDCKYYEGSNVSSLRLVSTESNIFGQIAVNEYKNNNCYSGDFEKVVSLIDAYDLMCSDTLNELNYFSDAYLLFENCEIDTDTIQDMKNNRIIQAQTGESGQAAKVSWLTKNSNDVQCENTKQRTVDEIHKLSKVPNLDPSAFTSHTTASHVYYSLLATEDLVSKKEKKFKKGLQQRLEKIVHMLILKSLINPETDYRDITITFTRNIPQDWSQLADPISKLRDLVSDETLLAKLGVTNPIEELNKRDADREKQNASLFNDNTSFGEEVEDNGEQVLLGE